MGETKRTDATKMTTYETTACAKVNLTLSVLGSRADGFHELRSLVVGVDLRDTISATLTTEPGIELVCNNPSLSHGENLVVIAAERLASRVSRPPAIRFSLTKRIPVGAGLGGGSSDAASALRLCQRAWNIGEKDASLTTVGAEIGSDVPLFFALPAATMSGRGEVVQSVEMSWRGWMLLVFAGPLVPTAEVYAAFRRADRSNHREDSHLQAQQASTADELSAMLYNDLELAVFRVSPRVKQVADALHGTGIGGFRVSGAGSALYKLYDHQEAATYASTQIDKQGIGVATAVVSAPVGLGPILIREI